MFDPFPFILPACLPGSEPSGTVLCAHTSQRPEVSACFFYKYLPCACQGYGVIVADGRVCYSYQRVMFCATRSGRCCWAFKPLQQNMWHIHAHNSIMHSAGMSPRSQSFARTCGNGERAVPLAPRNQLIRSSIVLRFRWVRRKQDRSCIVAMVCSTLCKRWAAGLNI